MLTNNALSVVMPGSKVAPTVGPYIGRKEWDRAAVGGSGGGPFRSENASHVKSLSIWTIPEVITAVVVRAHLHALN